MTSSAALRIVALVALGVVPIGCWVSRRSEGYACTHSSDCDASRTCDNGYCVLRQPECPSGCTSCDLTAMTCRIECTAGKPCGDVTCPAGFDCTVRCNNSGACGDVTCGAGKSCDISCSGQGSCQAIDCATTRCHVQCSGAAACPFIGCANACRCDVTCGNPAACPGMACPRVGASFCTSDGTAGGVCDPGFDSQCDRCP